MYVSPWILAVSALLLGAAYAILTPMPPAMGRRRVTVSLTLWMLFNLSLVSVGWAVGEPEQSYPPCVAEDGGPIPCQWDGGVNENGHRVTIVYRER